MLEQQLDLFASPVAGVAWPAAPSRDLGLAVHDLDDVALVAAIPGSTLADSAVLAAESGSRRLPAAVPGLLALCRRFTGFGSDHIMPEQVAALRALAEIGGRDAAEAIVATIERGIVRGPTLQAAVNAAARLRAKLSERVLTSLFGHPDPAIRADACRCTRPLPELIARLIRLLDDGDQGVSRAAAYALGSMGRIEARSLINTELRHAPSEDTIEAAVLIADEETVVLLGRIARAGVGLSGAALEALEDINQPRANGLAAAIRRGMPRKDDYANPGGSGI